MWLPTSDLRQKWLTLGPRWVPARGMSEQVIVELLWSSPIAREGP